MNLRNTYMLVFSLLLINVNGGGGAILYNSFPLQLQQLPFLRSFLVLLEINRFSNSFLFIYLTFGKGGENPCVDNPNGSYKLYCPRRSCELPDSC